MRINAAILIVGGLYVADVSLHAGQDPAAAKNGFPAGDAELPTQTEILKGIKILTQKP